MQEALYFFKGDEMAARVYLDKYAAKDSEGNVLEPDPRQMLDRIIKEFARIEKNYINPIPESTIRELLEGFRYIVCGGSVLASLGLNKPVSLSNCFVIGEVQDSIEDIYKLRTEQAHLMKRRGGVGKDLSGLRPRGAKVDNAALSSTGAASFMDVDSSVTNEIAQGGRRGALMLTISIDHPDAEEFIESKQDLTKITGANISVKVSSKFMEAVQKGESYLQKWPIDASIDESNLKLKLNELTKVETINHKEAYVKLIDAKQLWNKLIHCAWATAEPGIMFENAHWDKSPDGVYPQYRGVSTNPCFHPDTLIQTVEGLVRIADIKEPTFVYSMTKAGRLCVVPASAAFKTKKNVKTLKITLRNGSSIMVTPDHKLFVQDVGFVEAQNLKVGDKITCLLRNIKEDGRTGVKLTTESDLDFTLEDKLVYSSVYNKSDLNQIYHIDGNKQNNNITNLCIKDVPEISVRTESLTSTTTTRIYPVWITSPSTTSWYTPSLESTQPINTYETLFDNCIISIEPSEQTDVYDIQVPQTHCLIANNMVAHNCGEIFMSAYDSCRLLHINLLSLVENPFTPEAYFNYTKAQQVFYAAVKLGDDLVDLEVEAVDRIINKIETSTLESYRSVEWSLWQKVRATALEGRRCGIGFTALADMCAALGISYNSTEGIEFIDSLMKLKLQVECQAQCDLASQRGTFKEWDNRREFTISEDGKLKGANDFYNTLVEILPEDLLRNFYQLGHRNVSWSTVAPTGTVSMMTQTSSGIEPVFMPYYQRSKTAGPNDRVDFIDDTGKKFTNFIVIHPQLKHWATIHNYPIDTPEQIQATFEQSPYYGATANEISSENRVLLQATVQKYITHSISSTVNLPNGTTEQQINNIYIEAFNKGCKGITVYRDGCRAGILNAVGKTQTEIFPQNDAPKRPKTLKAKSFVKRAHGKSYAIVVGLLDNKPYEIFATTPVPPGFISQEGTITKVKKRQYKWVGNTGDVLSNIGQLNTDEERACALSTSALLRHGAKLPFVIKTLQKIGSGITAFATVLARTLAEFDKEVIELSEKCPKCGGRLVREAGCVRCLDCTHSACLLLAKDRNENKS